MFTEADAVFQRRLDPAADRPVAVAVSGGGDSALCLIATARWAAAAGRPVIALHVDHELQAASGEWADFVRQAAARHGVAFRALSWAGPKPLSGVPAAARIARHRLLADAARDAGALVLVTGHTADDARENALMGLGTLGEWSPSPVWPQGRGLFLLRPLLAMRRAAIRQALTQAGETWIDDPANDDLRHPRIRARRGEEEPAPSIAPAGSADLAAVVECLAGGFRLDRSVLLNAEPAAARRVLAAAMTCTGGGERPPRSARVDAMMARLRGVGEVRATLAGARLVADDLVIIARDAGETRRGGLAPLPLMAGKTAVWDGRYEARTDRAGLILGALTGHATQLSAPQRAALARLPALLRPATPAVFGADRPVCPTLMQDEAASAASIILRDLTRPRFLAACDAIAHESELAQGAHGATDTGVLCSRPVRK